MYMQSKIAWKPLAEYADDYPGVYAALANNDSSRKHVENAKLQGYCGSTTYDDIVSSTSSHLTIPLLCHGVIVATVPLTNEAETLL